MESPVEIRGNASGVEDRSDHCLIIAASWEGRCLGLAENFGEYRASNVLLVEYDSPSPRREENLKKLRPMLRQISDDRITPISASHAKPLASVRNIVDHLKRLQRSDLRLSIDISSFTRKHLLQLLHGLDRAGLLSNTNFFYTEAADYDTQDDEGITEGIRSVRAVDSFMGENYPSRDSLLVIFLGYEGRRALVLYEHLEPNVTIAVIPDPPFHPEWRGRTESQNCYLLSTIPRDRILKTHALMPRDTEVLLEQLLSDQTLGRPKYNYRIAPLGTKPQGLGVYRFWRRFPGVATIMYASPVRYREDRANVQAGTTWLIDNSRSWNPQND